MAERPNAVLIKLDTHSKAFCSYAAENLKLLFVALPQERLNGLENYKYVNIQKYTVTSVCA